MGRGYLTDADKEWGRPTLYKDDYPDKLRAYFEVPLRGDGGKATDMPTLAGFAASIGVAYQTIKKWRDSYPDFAEAYDACKAKTLDRLIKFGLTGDYSGNFAKFLMVNDFCDDYKDRRDLDVKQDATISFSVGCSQEDLEEILP